MFRKLTAMAAVLAMALVLTSSVFAGEKVAIGVLMKTMSDTYSNKLGEAIKDYSRKTYPDVELLLVDAQADIGKQISQAEDLIAKRVGVVILNAQDAEGSAQVLYLCEEAGIPVVEVNTQTIDDNYTAYVGSHDVEAGEIMGNHALKLLGGKGKVVILEGNMGQSPQLLRKQGLDNTILAAPGIELLAILTADWARDKAMAITEDWLGKYPQIDAILCENDDMAMGALQAVESSGRTGVVIIGVDAIPDALDAVAAGRMTASVLQDAFNQAKTVVDVAYKVAKGEKVEKDYKVPFQLITKENVKDFIE
jgi:ABC-type sugar transport system, periplasmic component